MQRLADKDLVNLGQIRVVSLLMTCFAFLGAHAAATADELTCWEDQSTKGTHRTPVVVCSNQKKYSFGDLLLLQKLVQATRSPNHVQNVIVENPRPNTPVCAYRTVTKTGNEHRRDLMIQDLINFARGRELVCFPGASVRVERVEQDVEKLLADKDELDALLKQPTDAHCESSPELSTLTSTTKPTPSPIPPPTVPPKPTHLPEGVPPSPTDVVQGFVDTLKPHPNDPKNLDLCLAIDLSGSMADNVRSVSKAMPQLAGLMKGHYKNVRINVIEFCDKDGKPFLNQAVNNGDLDSLKNYFASFKVLGCSDEPTSLALAACTKTLGNESDWLHQAIVFTDEPLTRGDHFSGAPSIAQVQAKALDHGVRLKVINPDAVAYNGWWAQYKDAFEKDPKWKEYLDLLEKNNAYDEAELTRGQVEQQKQIERFQAELQATLLDRSVEKLSVPALSRSTPSIPLQWREFSQDYERYLATDIDKNIVMASARDDWKPKAVSKKFDFTEAITPSLDATSFIGWSRKHLRVFDVTTEKETDLTPQIDFNEDIVSAVLAPDGKRAAVSTTQSLYFFEKNADGWRLKHKNNFKPGYTERLFFWGNQNVAAIRDDYGTINIEVSTWDLSRTTRTKAFQINGQRGRIYQPRYNPDDESLTFLSPKLSGVTVTKFALGKGKEVFVKRVPTTSEVSVPVEIDRNGESFLSTEVWRGLQLRGYIQYTPPRDNREIRLPDEAVLIKSPVSFQPTLSPFLQSQGWRPPSNLYVVHLNKKTPDGWKRTILLQSQIPIEQMRLDTTVEVASVVTEDGTARVFDLRKKGSEKRIPLRPRQK